MPSKSPHGIFELAPSRTLGLTSSLFYAACGLLLFALAVSVYFYWRSKNKRTAQTQPVLTPWEQIQLQLQRLGELSSPTESMTVLNHSLRRGMELRLKEPYTAFTSAEILTHLQMNSQFSSDFQAECAEFLKTADRVLFAYQPYEEEERVRWQKQVAQWLERMREGQTL